MKGSANWRITSDTNKFITHHCSEGQNAFSQGRFLIFDVWLDAWQWDRFSAFVPKMKSIPTTDGYFLWYILTDSGTHATAIKNSSSPILNPFSTASKSHRAFSVIFSTSWTLSASLFFFRDRDFFLTHTFELASSYDPELTQSRWTKLHGHNYIHIKLIFNTHQCSTRRTFLQCFEDFWLSSVQHYFLRNQY